MEKVSVVIPSRQERYLSNTIADLLSRAAGDVEVIAVLDGYWPDPPLSDDHRLIVLHRGAPLGMRAAINAGAGIAKGAYLMKCDAHCAFAPAWDLMLQDNCDVDWVVVPRRYRLDADAWQVHLDRPIDYHYLCNPWTSRDHALHGVLWKRPDRVGIMLDDEMSSQGSCWFMPKGYFWNHLGGLSEVGYGTFTQEFQEIGMKTWLGGGQVKVNKNTWYAHWHKKGRGYSLDQEEIQRGAQYSAHFWTENCWDERVYDFDWLIDKFWPVPTWEDDWRERYVH